jgi:hypothetical protein
MKMRSGKAARTLTEISTIVTIALAIAGCSGPGYKKGNAAAAGLQSAAKEVQAQSQTLDLTVAALRDLVDHPSGDLTKQYQYFSSCLDRFVSEARRTESSGQSMKKLNAEYLQAWDKEAGTIEYAHVRELSQKRKTDVANDIEALQQRYKESQAVVQPLIAYLEDIRKALGADLTPAGIESMKGVVENADANASKVQTALGALTTAMNDSGAKMSSLAFQHTNAQATP